MTQSGIGAASETYVAALSSGQSLDFDDDTLKGKDIHYCYLLITKIMYDSLFGVLNRKFSRISLLLRSDHLH